MYDVRLSFLMCIHWLELVIQLYTMMYNHVQSHRYIWMIDHDWLWQRGAIHDWMLQLICCKLLYGLQPVTVFINTIMGIGTKNCHLSWKQSKWKTDQHWYKGINWLKFITILISLLHCSNSWNHLSSGFLAINFWSDRKRKLFDCLVKNWLISSNIGKIMQR